MSFGEVLLCNRLDFCVQKKETVAKRVPQMAATRRSRVDSVSRFLLSPMESSGLVYMSQGRSVSAVFPLCSIRCRHRFLWLSTLHTQFQWSPAQGDHVHFKLLPTVKQRTVGKMLFLSVVIFVDWGTVIMEQQTAFSKLFPQSWKSRNAEKLRLREHLVQAMMIS